MATTSFGQKFYVTDRNIDTFIDTINSAPEKKNGEKFESRLLTKDKLEQFVKENKIDR